MASALPISAEMRAWSVDCQGVEVPRTLLNTQKGVQKKTTGTTIRHKQTGLHRSG